MTELSAAEQQRIAASNMVELSLDRAQYTEFERLMLLKMTDWPDDLWSYVQAVVRTHMLCGEVINAAVADYLRGTDLMTGMRPPTMPWSVDDVRRLIRVDERVPPGEIWLTHGPEQSSDREAVFGPWVSSGDRIVNIGKPLESLKRPEEAG